MHIGSIQARHTSGSVGGQQIDEFRSIANLLRCAATWHKNRAFASSNGARRLLGPDQATILKFAEKEYDMKGTCPGQIIVDLVEKAVSCDDEEAPVSGTPPRVHGKHAARLR